MRQARPAGAGQADRSRVDPRRRLRQQDGRRGLRRRARAGADPRDGVGDVHQRGIRGTDAQQLPGRSRRVPQPRRRHRAAGRVPPEASKYILAGDVASKAAGSPAAAGRRSGQRLGGQVGVRRREDEGRRPAGGRHRRGRLRSALGDTTVDPRRRDADRDLYCRLARRVPRDTPRQESVLAGRHDEEAVAALPQAIEFDPKFGRAYSGLAVSHSGSATPRRRARRSNTRSR